MNNMTVEYILTPPYNVMCFNVNRCSVKLSFILTCSYTYYPPTRRILECGFCTWNQRELLNVLPVIESLGQTPSLSVLAGVSLGWWVLQWSSPAPCSPPLTLSTASLCLTGEASHLDWQRDWEVLSQPRGDQGEGKWSANINPPHTHTSTLHPLI